MDSKTITPTKPIPFDEQTEFHQVMLIKGVCQQVTMLAYPKLSAANNQLKNIGLQLVSVESLKKISSNLAREARELSKSLDMIEKRSLSDQEYINAVKMILMSGKSDNEKVSLIHKLNNI